MLIVLLDPLSPYQLIIIHKNINKLCTSSPENIFFYDDKINQL